MTAECTASPCSFSPWLFWSLKHHPLRSLWQNQGPGSCICWSPSPAWVCLINKIQISLVIAFLLVAVFIPESALSGIGCYDCIFFKDLLIISLLNKNRVLNLFIIHCAKPILTQVSGKYQSICGLQVLPMILPPTIWKRNQYHISHKRWCAWNSTLNRKKTHIWTWHKGNTYRETLLMHQTGSDRKCGSFFHPLAA